MLDLLFDPVQSPSRSHDAAQQGLSPPIIWSPLAPSATRSTVSKMDANKPTRRYRMPATLQEVFPGAACAPAVLTLILCLSGCVEPTIQEGGSPAISALREDVLTGSVVVEVGPPSVIGVCDDVGTISADVQFTEPETASDHCDAHGLAVVEFVRLNCWSSGGCDTLDMTFRAVFSAPWWDTLVERVDFEKSPAFLSGVMLQVPDELGACVLFSPAPLLNIKNIVASEPPETILDDEFLDRTRARLDDAQDAAEPGQRQQNVCAAAP
jgi:hypothetical protein